MIIFLITLLNTFFTTILTSLKIVNFFLTLSKILKRRHRLIIIKLYRLIAVKLYQKSVYKEKEKKYRVFNAKVNNNNDDDFFFKFKEKEKINNEITALFKKTVSKMFKSK